MNKACCILANESSTEIGVCRYMNKIGYIRCGSEDQIPNCIQLPVSASTHISPVFSSKLQNLQFWKDQIILMILSYLTLGSPYSKSLPGGNPNFAYIFPMMWNSQLTWRKYSSHFHPTFPKVSSVSSSLGPESKYSA